ncbi:4-hydroxyphenylacetate 3-monooxygenase, oxygenase component [Escherichia coli]|nr:4-hydroxyphenylacetate 3-monooxygenase, oxygenase component [Escherichia coli]
MKPEDFRASTQRPFTGEEYLKSLQDGREIYIYGERVKDVTTHPAFRNAAASVAQLYDALHKPEMQDSLCWNTDTGSGGYTHKFFRVAKSADDLRQQRDAIAEWSRLSYGWMGRTPDYKAAFGCALGANPGFYGQFEQNARNWYTRIQETGLYFNHAIVNPPIDRHLPTDKVKDVYIKLEKETDAGIIVSGAKVVATNSALTHYNMIGFGSAQVMGENPDFALMFVAPMDADGVKLISRASYEMVAGATGSPYDYPLSSRFDENDAILVMDNVLIPWENVLIYRDFDRCRRWTMEGGFARMYPLQACVRLAVKLDFITALLKKSLECTGTLEFRGVQADLGEVVAWRNTFWALSDSMCSEATPWVNGAYLPDHAALQTYRVLAPMAYAKIKNIIERNVTSGLIYLPSSARDLNNPQIPVCLWFMTKSKAADPAKGYRDRQGETLFIDARNLGTMISRTTKELTTEDIATIADTYHAWRSTPEELAARIARGDSKLEKYEDQAGFCKVATLQDIKDNDYVLTPGRYVGAAEQEDDGVAFETKMRELSKTLFEQMKQAEELDRAIRQNLEALGYGE